MPKTDLSFDPALYAPVAERITLFYERHPSGRIETVLVDRTDGIFVFRASVYRSIDDAVPSATGWAAERDGDGDVNSVACLENTETSAIGRALANLGFTAGRERPSREEMVRARNARLRLAGEGGGVTGPAAKTARPASAAPRVDTDGASDEARVREHALSTAVRLLTEAERCGVPAHRTERWGAWLRTGEPSLVQIRELELRIRRWLVRHQ